MDILQFINSKDIRKHLKKINYQFNTLEVAWLIYHSYNHSVYEKFNAYEQLMKEYPDCRVKKRLHTPAQDSLFEYLKNYIKVYRNAIYEFEAPDAVYSIKVKYFEGTFECEATYNIMTMFTNLDAVKQQCKIEMDDETKEIKSFVISKHIPKNKENIRWVYPRKMVLKGDDLKLISVDFNTGFGFDLLKGLWFDFPTPFKSGDIVWDKYYCALEPKVILDIRNNNLSKNLEYLKNYADDTDMSYECYCMFDSNSIFSDIDYNYMDLEYYPYELTDKDRALLPISRFLKGDIDIGLCCNAFHNLSLADYMEKSMPRGYTDEIMKELGIKNEKYIQKIH